jgi:hypothetical protein
MEVAAFCQPTWLKSASRWLEACFANGFFQPLAYEKRSITVPSHQQQLQDNEGNDLLIPGGQSA